MRQWLTKRLGKRSLLVIYLLVLSCVTGLWILYPVRPKLTLQLPAPCQRVVVSADGRTLATATPEALTLWDLPSGQPRHTLPMNGRDTSLFLASDGSRVVFSGQGTTGIWTPSRGPEPLILADVSEVCHVSDRFVITGGNRTLTIWDVHTGQRLQEIALSEDDWTVGYLGSDGRWLVLQADPSYVTVWDLHQNGPLLRIFQQPFGEVLRPDMALLLNDQARLLATIGSEKISVWDLRTGREVNAIAWSSTDWNTYTNAVPVAFSPDGSRLLTSVSVVGGSDRPLSASEPHTPFPADFHNECWDLTTRPPRKLGSLRFNYFWSRRIGFSPDGQWLLDFQPESGSLGLRATADLRPQVEFTANRRFDPIPGLTDMSFGPNSRTVTASGARAVGSLTTLLHTWLGARPPDNTTVQMWDVPTGRELLYCPGGSAFVYSPDGILLVVWGVEQPVQVWEVPPRRPVLIDYGLPALLVVLLLWGYRRRRRGVVDDRPTVASC